MDILDILRRESEDSSQVYLYEEEGHWYAYEQSAILIGKLLKGIVTIKQFIYETYELVLNRVEITDLSFLERCAVTSCSDSAITVTLDEYDNK